MGTSLDSIFFTHNNFFQLGFRANLDIQIIKKSVGSKTFQYNSLETREFLYVKTIIGIQWFEDNLLVIFSFSRNLIESWSNWLQISKQIAWSLWMILNGPKTRDFFVSHNFCGYTTVWSSFSSDFVVFVTINQKCASNWLYIG